ncbi:hypothetical protein V8G54_031622, partial [Vigna mungo]
LRFPSSIGSHRQNSVRAVSAEAVQVRLPAPSFYEVLRIQRHASPTEIKSAYRSLAKLYHPDAVVRHATEDVRAGEAADGNFIQIRSAYETLSDPSARAEDTASFRFLLVGITRRRFTQHGDGKRTNAGRWSFGCLTSLGLD